MVPNVHHAHAHDHDHDHDHHGPPRDVSNPKRHNMKVSPCKLYHVTSTSETKRTSYQHYRTILLGPVKYPKPETSKFKQKP